MYRRLRRAILRREVPGRIGTILGESRSRIATFRFPTSKYPVLAFTGPPASFPVMTVNRPLQKHLRWSESIAKQARGYVEENFNPRRGRFIGIHLRNERDWVQIVFIGFLYFFRRIMSAKLSRRTTPHDDIFSPHRSA